MHVQEAELEDFLFAGNAGDIAGFGKEDKELDRRSALAQLIARVGKVSDSAAKQSLVQCHFVSNKA
jgi:hypothetical protein